MSHRLRSVGEVRARSVLRRLERAATSREARDVLRQMRLRNGMTEMLVEAIIAHAATAPERARQIAKWWRLLLIEGDDEAQALRLKSLLHRLDGKWEQAAVSALDAAKRAKSRARANALRLGAVDALARAGKPAEATRLGRSLIRQLEKDGDVLQAARARLNVGNALLWQDRYAEAERMYREAEPALSAGGRDLEAAAALLGLSACNLFGGKPTDALNAATQAEERFRSIGATFHAWLAEVNALQARSLLGEPDKAALRLRQILSRLEGVSPPDAARAEEFLGDAFVRLNLWEEGKECFRSALRRPELRHMPLNKANCRYGLALASLGAGDAGAAKRDFARAHREYMSLNNQPWAAAAAAGAAEACLERGELEDAKQWARAALESLKGRSSPRIEARANLIAARCTGSIRHLRRADALSRRYTLVDERWRVQAEYARSDPRQARQRYRRMFAAILEARLLVSSRLARSAFLRDKERALREYLALLLERPDRDSMREALDVVVRSRSLTLIDEILSARGAALGEGERKKLDDLRRRLAAALVEPPGARSSSIVAPRSLLREWAEIANTILLKTSNSIQRSTPAGAVIIETTRGVFVLQGEKATPLGEAQTDWGTELDWLSFDLLAPTVDAHAPAAACIESLERFANIVSAVMGARFISPSGALWRVPWQALALLRGQPEPVVLYSPAFNIAAGECRLSKPPRVAIWAGRSDDLPGAMREVEELLQIHPRATVFRTLAEVQACLSGQEFDLLHVVGHATVSTENPMFSRLEFPDGPLFAVEVASSALRVGAVILSACDTGRAPLWSLSEPDGLARAFLACGARWAVASQWALDDLAGGLLAGTLHRELKRGSPVKDALRAARVKVRTMYEHPYYWAPMFLLGGHGA